MAVESELSLSVEVLDSMLIKLLGGEEGDSLAALFKGETKTDIFSKIDDEVVSKKVQFVAYHPRGKTGTKICTSLDGSIYDADDPNIPAIPQHFNCRSQYRFIDGTI